jgi:integrase
MTLYKRGSVYWYNFKHDGVHIQKSTRQSNLRVARQIEAAHRTSLAKGEAGIGDRKTVPTLRDFGPRFLEFVEVNNASQPQTVLFYKNRLARLLDFAPLARTRLDKIDAADIEAYVQNRSKQVSVTSVNRELAALSRLLHIAVEWKLIPKVPKIRRLKGEKQRSFVLSYDQEREYLRLAPQPLYDAAILLLDTGLRVGELVNLQWADIHLEPVGSAKFGYLQVRGGKSANAKRTVPLTARARKTLIERRDREPASVWVFPGLDGNPRRVNTLDQQHRKITRPKVNGVKVALFSDEFVIHSLRHTMLTRLGESGADAFTIMQIAGHSSVTVSQKYVHPTPETVERAFDRLEKLNSLAGKPKFDLKAFLYSTDFRTPPESA